MHTMGEAGVVVWEAAIGSLELEGVGSTDNNRVPWPREEGLARDQDQELWPPLVFAMTTV